ncbi:MAG TPA: metal ABC transporter ATP-binding protein [Pedobacter sp.]
MQAIEIQNLDFSYGKELILKNISMNIRQGDFVVLTGGNGTGKSTLLKLLLGEVKPLHGIIKIMGTESGKMQTGGKIGYVAQNGTFANQNFPATVEEIVMANLYKQIGRFRFPSKDHRIQVSAALNQLDMERFGKAMIGELSGGQQQRVMLARALVTEPELLIMDEPTNGIDLKSVRQLYDILETLHKEKNLTILMVTHASLKECGGITRILQLEDGKISELIKDEVKM